MHFCDMTNFDAGKYEGVIVTYGCHLMYLTTILNNITAWTGLMLNDILRKTEERSEWRAVIWYAVNPRIEED